MPEFWFCLSTETGSRVNRLVSLLKRHFHHTHSSELIMFLDIVLSKQVSWKKLKDTTRVSSNLEYVNKKGQFKFCQSSVSQCQVGGFQNCARKSTKIFRSRSDYLSFLSVIMSDYMTDNLYSWNDSTLQGRSFFILFWKKNLRHHVYYAVENRTFFSKTNFGTPLIVAKKLEKNMAQNFLTKFCRFFAKMTLWVVLTPIYGKMFFSKYVF